MPGREGLVLVRRGVSVCVYREGVMQGRCLCVGAADAGKVCVWVGEGVMQGRGVCVCVCVCV